MHAPRAIVLIRLSAIGDVVHGIPAAVALRYAFPNARIGWAVEGRSADVLAGHHAIDHLFRLPRGWLRSPRAVLRFRRQLRWFGAEVAIDLQGLLKSGIATLLSGARMRIGHARPTSREHAWLAYTHPVKATATHIVDRTCELLAPLGLAVPAPAFEMPRWPVSRDRVRQWLDSLRLSSQPVLLNPGAGWESKRWPPARFAAVARVLSRRGGEPTIVVWGGPEERALAERIAAESFGTAVVAPETSLQDLGELCRASRLLISGDTGPLHLAAAVGTPCVGLFGPVPASRNGPYGPIHACVEPPPALRPAWDDRKTDSLSMGGIDVERVVEAARSILASSQAA